MEVMGHKHVAVTDSGLGGGRAQGVGRVHTHCS